MTEKQYIIKSFATENTEVCSLDDPHSIQAMNFKQWIATICSLALLVSFLAPAIHDASHHHTNDVHAHQHDENCGAPKEALFQNDSKGVKEQIVINIVPVHKSCSLCTLIQHSDPVSSYVLARQSLEYINKETLYLPLDDLIKLSRVINYYQARAGPSLS